MTRASKVNGQMSFTELCERHCQLLQSTWDYVCYCSISLTVGNHIFCDRPAFKRIMAGCSKTNIRHKSSPLKMIGLTIGIHHFLDPGQFFFYPYYNRINGISSVFSIQRNSQLDGRSPCSGILRCSQA